MGRHVQQRGTFTKAGGSGTLTVSGVVFSNAGTLQVASGTLALNSGLTNIGGTYDIAQGVELDLTGGDFQGGFAFTLPQGTAFDLTGGRFLGSFSFTVPQGATLDLTGGTFQGDFLAVAQGAVVDLTGGNYQGTFTGSGGGTVSLVSGTLTLTGATTFDFPAGMFQWSGWINTNGQTLTNPSTGFMTIINPSGTNAYPDRRRYARESSCDR